MSIVSASTFAAALRITDRAARKAFGLQSYRGEHLPLVQVPGQRGGKGGAVWALSYA